MQKINKIISKCDPTYSAIYSILNTLKISTQSNMFKRRLKQIAVKTPSKIRSIDLINNPGNVIQYLYNRDDFVLDSRKIKSLFSIEKDIENIKARIDPKILESKNPMDLLSVYNDLMICKEKKIVMMGYSKNTLQLISSIKDVLTNNLFPFVYVNVVIHDVIKVYDPISGDLLYLRGSKLTTDLYQQILDNVCLIYTYLTLKEKKTIGEIKKIIGCLEFIVDRETNVKMTFNEIIKKYTLSYFEQYNIDINTKKIAAYLLSLLYNQTDLLNDLLKTIFSYSYNYIKKSDFISDKYVGECLIQITHNKEVFLVYQNPDVNERPILIYHRKPTERVLILHYNIALRLTGYYNDDEFVLNMNKNNIKFMKLPFVDDYKYKKFCQENEIQQLFKLNNDELINIDYKSYNQDENYLPILTKKHSINKYTTTKAKLNKLVPTIKHNKLGVYIGKQKVYTMPFWKCSTHDVVDESCNEYKIDDIGIYDLFKFNILSDYFNGYNLNTTQYNYKGKVTDYIDELKFYINENKIYNLNYDKLINELNSEKNYSKKMVIDFLSLIGKKSDKILPDQAIIPIPESKQIINISKEMEYVHEQQTLDFGKTIDKNLNINILDSIVTDFGDIKDFLFDDEIDETKIDENTGILEDESDIFEYNPSKASLSKDILMDNIGQYNLPNFFVEKPFKRSHKYEGKIMLKQNYIIRKLNHQPKLGLYTIKYVYI